MNKRTIYIIIITLLISALAIFTIMKKGGGYIYNDFLISDTSTVEKIFMVNKKSEQLTLSKKEGNWVLKDGELAIGENVNILLKTLMYIDIRRPVSKSSYNTVVKQLATNSVKVEIYQKAPLFTFLGIKAFVKTRKTKEFYVGSPTRDYKGTIMKMGDSEDIYITYLPGFKGYLTERFSANYSDWVNHNIFKIPIRSIVKVKVEFGQEPTQSYEIENIGNRNFNLISMHNGIQVANYDTLRLLETLSSFRSINFETLLDKMPQKRIDSLSNSIPYRSVSVTTIDQRVIRLRMYQRPNFDQKPDFKGNVFKHDMDRMYALVDGFAHPVTVQYFVVDKITRPLSFLLGMPMSNSNYNGFQVGK